MYVKIIENALNELNKKIPGTTTNVERLEMVLAMMSSRTMVGRDKNKLPFTMSIFADAMEQFGKKTDDNS